jgi:hypothetical protein
VRNRRRGYHEGREEHEEWSLRSFDVAGREDGRSGRIIDVRMILFAVIDA